MRLLHLDIETAPHRVYAWGLWGQDIAINQIEEPGYTLCWAAKWHQKSPIMFDSLHQSSAGSMIAKIHALIDEADAVVHYNGTKFDMPTLTQEFVIHGLGPPSPYKQIDLLHTARKRFRLPSNKLDYVAQHLGLGKKLEHKGMELWKDCMNGDDAAWNIMERYNKQDVRLLEKVYKRLLPWIENHPNRGIYSDKDRPECVNCGSSKVQRRGYERTKTMVYPRFQCTNCGKWLKGRKNVTPPEKKENVLVEAK